MEQIAVVPPTIQIIERGSQLWTTSLDLAEKFGKRHDRVMQSIRELECPDDFRLHHFVETNYLDSHNREQPMVEMTRDGFTLLAMGFTGKPAMAWKIKYIQAFDAMERRLIQIARQAERRASIEYQQARADGKLARRSETDTIKAFVSYAESQGSKNAFRYYTTITTMTYKSLGFIEKSMPGEPIRELLDRIGLANLATAEYLVSATIDQGMKDGKFYKDVFQDCKAKLIQFAAVVGKRPLLTHTA